MLSERASRFLRFSLERWIQRGTLYQLFLMAGLIVLVAILGGLTAWLGTDQFAKPWTAIWWAFLRLTDPGYLGDDEGAFLRTVSTAVTVAGYVLFMGSLIAILSAWLNQSMRDLESGLTPISMEGHVVILGWTNRTPEIVARLLSAGGRLERFLRNEGASHLRVVVLTERVDAQLRASLRAELAEVWDGARIFLRSGSSLQPEDLERLDLARASVVLVPGSDLASASDDRADTRVVQTLLMLDDLFADLPLDERPRVVAEIADSEKVRVARSTMRTGLEIVPSESVVARLLTQGIRHPRLASVLLQLLTHRRGASIYVRSFEQFAGEHPACLTEHFPRAILLGALRPQPTDAGTNIEPHLNPPAHFRLEAGDQLVLLADSYSDCEPHNGATTSQFCARRPFPRTAKAQAARVLVLGWSHKLGALLAELDGYPKERFQVTILSTVPIPDRERTLAAMDWNTSRVELRHVEGDYTLEKPLAALDPASFDDIVFLASAWSNSYEESDARTVLGYVVLATILTNVPNPPEVLIELIDPDSDRVFVKRPGVPLVSPKLLSHMMAHVALRPELNGVFESLFGSGGSDIVLRRADEYALAGRTLDFATIQATAAAFGETALGLVRTRTPSERLQLNPSRSEQWLLEPNDEIVVLSDSETD